MPLIDLGPAPTKKKATGLIDLGSAPTPITEALTAVEQPTEERPRFEAAPEPGIGQRIKDYFRKPQMPVAYDLPEGRKYRTLPLTREEQPFRSLAELGAYGLGQYGVGRALYAPELITERPVEKLVAPISAAELTPKEKRIGESLKFIGGLRTAGQILGPVIATFPTASQQAIIGGSMVFGLRNITEQLVNWARTGKTPSLEAFEKDTALGALFGTAEAGLRGFVGFVKGLGNLRKGNVSWTNIKKPKDVADAIKHFQKTGDKSKWEAIRVKYAGITEEGATRIKARAEAIPSAEAKVKEFGRYPLARAGEPIRLPTELAAAPIRPKAPPEGIKPPFITPEAKIAPKVAPVGKVEAPKMIEPIEAFETRDYKSVGDFKDKGEFLDYIKPKLKATPHPHIPGSKTVRPYVVGYGCDGSTDANIHYVAQKMCKLLGLDYAEIYDKAYAWQKRPSERDWLGQDLGLFKDESLKTKPVKDTTIIPKNATIQDVLDDLYDINNRSLVTELEETLDRLGIDYQTKLSDIKATAKAVPEPTLREPSVITEKPPVVQVAKEIPPRPLVNPKATALQRDKQLLKQQAWDKKYGKPKPKLVDLGPAKKAILTTKEQKEYKRLQDLKALYVGTAKFGVTEQNRLAELEAKAKPPKAPEVKAVKKIPGAEVEAKPGPPKTLETIRKEGEQKADTTIVMPGNLENEKQFSKYIKQFPKSRSVGFPPVKAQKAITTRIKKFAQGVPEFKLNPTFTFEKKSGQLVFKDRYRFAFYPEHFGLDAEKLKDGQTIRFDLESFGIKKPTKKALARAEPFLGEPKVLGRVSAKQKREIAEARERVKKGTSTSLREARRFLENPKVSKADKASLEKELRAVEGGKKEIWKLDAEIGFIKEKLLLARKKPKGKPGFVDLTPIGDLGKFLVGDIEIEPVLEIESGAFNKHIDYFQGRQLPEGSQVRKIQKQMQVVNGQRLAGTITAQEANKKIRQLRKVLFETAQKEGIALRMTPGGKVSVAVRKAGTYVPVEFAEYKKFKDISPVFGGGQDITRAVQQMDGSLTVKQKVREKGQAGQLEQNVLWPTRDMSLQKLAWLKEKATELKGLLKVRKKSKADRQINLVLEQIASQDRNVPIKKILSNKTLRSMASPDVIRQAVKLREFYDNLIDEQNIARRIRGQKDIPYRRNYSPHILRDATIWERIVMKGKKAESIFAAKADLPDYIRPNKPFNPREMAREGGIPYEKRIISARDLAEIYLVTAGKDIFNTSIIQNNKAFIQQLEAMGFKKSANYLADWTAEAYAGVKPRLDRVVGLPVKAQKAALWWNRLRNMAVFPLNFAWNLVVQPSSLALTIGRYGAPNTMRGFLQWLVPSVRRHTAKNYYSYIVKASKQGKITKQDARNLIGSDVKLKMTPGEMIENAGGFITNQIEKLLTGVSIRAAHLHGKKRGLTGEALRNYASEGGAKTQSMYNDEDKPALLRNLTVKTAAPYQTFAYEVVNTAREWYGRTGTPPDTKLYRLWTVLRFLAAATVFAMIGKKLANRDVWSWKRPPIPFAEFWLSPIIKIFSKEYVGGSASGLVSPVGTAQRVAKGIDDVLETGSWRKLRNELIKYGPGIFGIPGGVQISRTVDAIIAYSQGGVRDRRGRLMFKMEDPQDLMQAIFSGVWTTKGGREVIERRQGKKQEGTRKKRMEREKRMLRK